MVLAEWLISRLDLPDSAGPPQGPARLAYQPEFGHDGAGAARVLYLRNSRQARDIQEIINSIRSVSEIQRITAFHKDSAIVPRGSEDQAAPAEWLLNHMDEHAGPQPGAALEYQMAADRSPIAVVPGGRLPTSNATAAGIAHPVLAPRDPLIAAMATHGHAGRETAARDVAK